MQEERKGTQAEGGTLYLCATPIGNLGDMTFRAVEVLREADLIAAEDTRGSIRLLNHFDIHTPMTSYHEHNKYDKARELADQMLAGKTVALVTDAGMPGISDPGEELVRVCMEDGIRVRVLPGACACVSALAVSGLSTRRFSFEGFLPPRKKERRAVLESLREEERTIVLYEAPHHLKETLADLYAALGDRRISICRELTKIYEEVLPLSLSGAAAYYEDHEPRGEYVLVVEGRSREDVLTQKQRSWEEISLEDHMERYLSQGMDRKEAMRAVAKDRGISKRDVYSALLTKQEFTE
jgi:16S rRNA (cytidine1402-2'-O)-methyltransferase